MTKPRIKLPESAKVGEVIEIKTLISHVMETGQRKGADGKTWSRAASSTRSLPNSRAPRCSRPSCTPASPPTPTCPSS